VQIRFFPAFAAAASPAAATTGAPDAAPVAGAARSASETAAEQAATARAVTAFAVAPTCASWSDTFEFPGSSIIRRFVIHIPITTRNDLRGKVSGERCQRTRSDTSLPTSRLIPIPVARRSPFSDPQHHKLIEADSIH